VISVVKVLDWDSEMDKVCGLWEVGAMLLIPGDVDFAEVVATGGASVLVNTVVLNEAVVGLLGLVVEGRLVVGLMVEPPRVGTVVVDPVATTVARPSVTVLVPPPSSARNWQLES
jgi:hypothetical protein